MVGKRVKLHLRALGRLYWIFSIGSAALVAVGIGLLLWPLAAQLSRTMLIALVVVASRLTVFLAGRLFGNVCQQYGLMTAAEAAALPDEDGYKEPWLEPLADKEEQGEEEATHRSATSAAIKR